MESSSSLSTVPRNDEGIPVKRSLYFCIAAAACTAFTATTALAARVHPSEPRTTATIPPSSSFSARIDNQWFPLRPGTRYLYTGVQAGKPTRDVMTVTHLTKTIEGVPCVVVSDRLYTLGRLSERTTDWYSQDSRGNVWYFGEDTAELDTHGHVTGTEGTWTAGVNGAQPGIYMPTRPNIGQSGRQEFYKGHAEDHFK